MVNRQIVGEEEHIKIVQGIQREIVARDLTKLTSPEVVSLLQLNKDQLEHTIKVTETGQKQISTFQMEEEIRIYDEIRASFPRESQKTLDAFLEGVWERR